jgi:peptidoglycan/LPS O-acetylase OafA/YrhL
MIKNFESIRGIAALIVALYHLNIGAAFFPVIRNGHLLVDLFFVLSGFIQRQSQSISSELKGPSN